MITGCDDGIERDEIDDAIDDGQQRGIELGDLANEDLGTTDEVTAMSMAAQIMIAIDEAEIFQAEAGLEVCNEDVVCDYANRMLDEHTLHAELVTDLVDRLGLTFLPTRASEAVREAAEDDVMRIVTSLTPDLTYMEIQLTMHEQGLALVGALDTHIDQLEFVNFLVLTQNAIAAHSTEAQAILRALF